MQLKEKEIPSSGWMRMVRTLGWAFFLFTFLKRLPGASWKKTAISVVFSARRLPALRKKGTPRPAPVVDEETHSREGLDIGLGIYILLFAVALHLLAFLVARAVLAAHDVAVDLLIGHRANRAEHFDLLIVDARGAKRDGGFHRNEAEQLHDVVLDDIAHEAGLFEELAPGSHADIFGDGDHHTVDMLVVPKRLVERVGKAKGEEVLDGLFGEVVVDTEDLIFGEVLRDLLLQGERGVEVTAKGLFDDHSRVFARIARVVDEAVLL